MSAETSANYDGNWDEAQTSRKKKKKKINSQIINGSERLIQCSNVSFRQIFKTEIECSKSMSHKETVRVT